MNLWEVFVTADEPWHQELKDAYSRAVLDLVESPLNDSEYRDSGEDHDGQLTTGCPSYAGWGTNVHPDAEGPVFSKLADAQRLADLIRYHTPGTTAGVFSLSNEE